MIEQTNFPYSPLGEAFEKQTKMIEYQGKELIDAITDRNESLRL